MKVDYLISGAGASALSFLDVMLTETNATIAVADRRDAPGGHWNDAYPFVRLHQQSSFYGVASRRFNPPRPAKGGFNAGLFELSTKSEILHYFHDLMENTYLPSGRVTYFPMSEHLGDGRVRSLITGEITEIEIGQKLVNAGLFGDRTTIPATHARPYEVAEGVDCVPPNDLPRRAPGHGAFTVIGAGKTGMDVVIWLLGRGVDPGRITWVRPNDYWMLHRDRLVFHPDFFETTTGSFEAELAAFGTASTVREFCEKMEASGVWCRIDPEVWPQRFHAAMCSGAEIAALRGIADVIRAGHVKRIEPNRLILQDAEVEVALGRLYVDCTARGGASLGPGAPPIFDGDTINLFTIRPFQPLLSAALIAFLEAKVPDEQVRKACTRLVDFHDTPLQYIAQAMQGIMNQGAWARVPEVKAWIEGCRLYAMNHLLAGLTPDDTERLKVLSRFKPLSKAAAENIPRILSNEAARVDMSHTSRPDE